MKDFYQKYKGNIHADFPLKIDDPLFKLKERYKDLEFVSGFGPLNSKIMFVGLCPYDEELKASKPFAGKREEKLHGIIKYLSRKLQLYNNIYYTLISWVPMKNDDLEKELDRLKEEIETVNPKNIIVFGLNTAEYMLKKWGPPMNKSAIPSFIKLNKVYPIYITSSLVELVLKNSETKEKVKIDLDFFISEQKISEKKRSE